MKSLALVVPSRNGSSRLPEVLKTLNKLHSLSRKSDNISIYFSNNNSSDGTSLLIDDYKEIFSNIFTWSDSLLFDQHLIEVFRIINETHIFFLGVNYLIDVDYFLEIWRLILCHSEAVDLTCIAGAISSTPNLQLKKSESKGEFFRECGHHMGGVSANIFARKIFEDNAFASYFLGSQWKTGESGWIHTALSLKVANSENSNTFYTTKAVNAQNPLGVNLKKGWHSPPEFPIMVRIQFYKVVFTFLDKKLHKYLGITQLPGLFDESLALYSSKLILNKDTPKIIFMLFNYCPKSLKPIYVTSMLLGLFFKLIKSFFNSHQVKN